MKKYKFADDVALLEIAKADGSYNITITYTDGKTAFLNSDGLEVGYAIEAAIYQLEWHSHNQAEKN